VPEASELEAMAVLSAAGAASFVLPEWNLTEAVSGVPPPGLMTTRCPVAAVCRVLPVMRRPLMASASSLSAVIAPVLMWVASMASAAIVVAVTALAAILSAVTASALSFSVVTARVPIFSAVRPRPR